MDRGLVRLGMWTTGAASTPYGIGTIRYLRSRSARVFPSRAGDGDTTMPAASMAAVFEPASPTQTNATAAHLGASRRAL
jgi:hypothetical protein